MAEECKRQIQLWSKGLAEGLNERNKSGKWRFLDARAVPGQLNGQDLDAIRQVLLPDAKRGFAAACIRKTKQAHPGSQVRPAQSEPRVFSHGCQMKFPCMCPNLPT